MKAAIWVAALITASFMHAQSNQPRNSQQSTADNAQVTVRGCVSKLNGDFVLIKQDPGNTYQLRKTDNIKLKAYLGQRVEITGTKSATIPTSIDQTRGSGVASPVEISVNSIKTISRECPTE
jgi:hypothetical protein